MGYTITNPLKEILQEFYGLYMRRKKETKTKTKGEKVDKIDLE